MAQTNQVPPLRVPAGWEGENRQLVIQLNLIIADLYKRVGQLKEQIKELENGGGS